MLFDAILQSPQFAANALSFFVSYILLPVIGLVAGFSFVIFIYGYIKKVHLGEYYTDGDSEGGALMGQGLLYMAGSAIVFLIAYYFLN